MSKSKDKKSGIPNSPVCLIGLFWFILGRYHVTEKGLKFAIVEVRAYYSWRADLEGINDDMIFAVQNFKAILTVELQITSEFD